VVLAALAWRRWPRVSQEAAPQPDVIKSMQVPTLQVALRDGDLAVIEQALCAAAHLDGDDLDAVRRHLDDPAQVDALLQLQAARWGDGDAESAVAALRSAFAKGARWRVAPRASESLLPPLYPE